MFEEWIGRRCEGREKVGRKGQAMKEWLGEGQN